jgi:hypothetical protein
MARTAGGTGPGDARRYMADLVQSALRERHQQDGSPFPRHGGESSANEKTEQLQALRRAP